MTLFKNWRKYITANSISTTRSNCEKTLSELLFLRSLWLWHQQFGYLILDTRDSFFPDDPIVCTLHIYASVSCVLPWFCSLNHAEKSFMLRFFYPKVWAIPYVKNTNTIEVGNRSHESYFIYIYLYTYIIRQQHHHDIFTRCILHSPTGHSVAWCYVKSFQCTTLRHANCSMSFVGPSREVMNKPVNYFGSLSYSPGDSVMTSENPKTRTWNHDWLHPYLPYGCDFSSLNPNRQ